MKRELLFKFFEGKTSLLEEMEIREWVEASEENYQTFLDERKLLDASILLPDRKEQVGSGNSRRLRKIMWEVGKIAAIMVLAFTATFSYFHFTSDNDEMVMQKIMVPAGQRINLELSDGTKVWLNSRSELKYPATFSKKKRTIHLDGEAYFEVSHNKKPFIVETNKGNVEVLGTKFNVEAYSDNDSFVTSLMEGAVKVTKENAEITLKPGQMASAQNGSLTVLPIDDYNIYRWKEGMICFRNEPLYDILKKFEKSYGVEIIVEDSTAKDFRFTGKFRQSDGIAYGLRVLQRDAKFQFERDEKDQKIYIR